MAIHTASTSQRQTPPSKLHNMIRNSSKMHSVKNKNKAVAATEALLAERIETNNHTRKQLQITNYIQGSALALTIHITHHAGTFICGYMRNFGPTPSFACMAGKSSWSHQETAPTIQALRPSFHFISWEFNKWGHLHDTDWEDVNLVSMIPMRHPLDRFMAGGKCGKYHSAIKADPNKDNQAIWWEYANSDCADNYALRVLTGENCVHGAETTLACLESAKNLLSRVTFILNQDCLEESLAAMATTLHLPLENDTNAARRQNLHHKHTISSRERIANDTLYEFVRHRFRRDIELYEWSKTRSVVQC